MSCWPRPSASFSHDIGDETSPAARATAATRRRGSWSASASSSRCAGSIRLAALLGRVRRGEIGGVILFGFNIRRPRPAAAADRAAAEGCPRGRTAAAPDRDRSGGRRRPTPAVGRAGRERVRPRAVERRTDPARGGSHGTGPRCGGGQRRSRARRGRAGRRVVHGCRPANLRGQPRRRSAAPSFLRARARRRARRRDREALSRESAGRRTTPIWSAVAIASSRSALDRDLVPFRAAIGAGVPIVMISNATYPALDAKPAAVVAAGPGAASGRARLQGRHDHRRARRCGSDERPDAALRLRARRSGGGRPAAADGQRVVERGRLRAARRDRRSGAGSARRRCGGATTGSSPSRAPTAEDGRSPALARYAPGHIFRRLT